MNLVFIKPDRPDFMEIEGVHYISTLALSNVAKVSDESKYKVFEKDYINGIELMDFAVHASFSNPRKMSIMLELVNLSRMLSPELDDSCFLSHAATETIMRNWNGTLPSEVDVNKWFVSNFKNLVGSEFEIATRKNDRKHMPDAWLIKEDSYWPVEIKLHSFNQKSLSQLLRYMNRYDCLQGIAVGSELECNLPENIVFIKHTFRGKRR